VLLYYFQGCPSWTWYYPYHYAPFGADFKDIGNLQIEFSKGKPFRPYEQLMGVMPARSNHTIPKVFHPLMTDEDSPIIEFYPEDFEIDLNGKKFAWQGVAVLPFIDEKRLLDAMGTKYPLLSDDEVRNAFGHEALIFSTRHPFYEEVAQNFYSKKAGAPKFKIDSKLSEGLSGKVEKAESYDPNSSLEFPLPTTQEKFTRLENDESVTVNYYMPENRGVHKSMLLPGIVFNPSALDYDDVQATRNRANKSGRSHGGVALTQNGGRSDGQRMNYGARDNGSQQNGGGYNAQNHGFGANGGYGGGPPPQRDNFSALPPGLAAQAAAHGVQHGPPPGFQQGPPRGGYGGRGGGYDSRPRQEGYGQYSQGGHGQGGYDQGRGGYGGQSRGGYNSQGRGGYGQQGGSGYGYGGGSYGNGGRGGGQNGGRRY
jgi:5'-3' exoribonuclease 2